MMTGRVADLIRDVPETAVRLYLGAKAEQHDDGIRIEIDSRHSIVSPIAYQIAQDVARVLLIRPRELVYATDVLELRHAAEEHFLSMVYGESANVPQILFVPAGEMAASFYRAMMPADTMTDRGTALAHYTERLDVSKALRYKILWIQLVSSPVLRQLAEIIQKEGVKIVYDVDDRWDASLKENNPSANLYAGERGEEVWKMIELADLVTVSTNQLAEFVRPRAKEVKVLPNLVPASICPNPASPNPDHKNILWAGSPTHKRDLAIVAPALRKILEKNKGKVRFVCFGENIPEALLPVSQYVGLIGFVSFEEYYEILSRVGADLAIAPLEANDFNDSKSAVKFLEYSACGYHTLMSPVGEYPEIPFDRKSLVQDDEWETAIEWHLAHPKETRSAGEAARSWVREHRCMIGLKAAPWLEAAKDLLAAVKA